MCAMGINRSVSSGWNKVYLDSMRRRLKGVALMKKSD